MKLPALLSCVFALAMLAACVSAPPARLSSYDPLGLGMNTPEYLFWLLTLQVGPPMHPAEGGTRF